MSILPSIMSPQAIREGFDLAKRAVNAFEAMAEALARQAAVMESDVAAELPETVDQTWERRYGEALEGILNTDGVSQLDKARNLRKLASTMLAHGDKTETKTGIG